MKTLWVDFETRSRCDLFSKGVYNYAQDASTDVLCMSYAFDDEPVVTWRPSDPFPKSVRNHTGQIRELMISKFGISQSTSQNIVISISKLMKTKSPSQDIHDKNYRSGTIANESENNRIENENS